MRRSDNHHLLIRALALLLGCPAAGTAQELRGRVLELGTDQSIRSALLSVRSRTGERIQQTFSDSAGRFSLRLPAAGRYEVAVSALGFAATSAPFVVPTDSVFPITVFLTPNAVKLQPIIVYGLEKSAGMPSERRAYLERRVLGIGTLIRRETIEASQPSRLSDVLRGVRGITIQPMGGTAGLFVAVSNRNLSRLPSNRLSNNTTLCPMLLFVDGVRFTSGATGLDVVNPRQIEAVEVFKGLGEMPPEFSGPDARCGAIAVWTRRNLN